jgi:hypothetical protein
MLFWKKEKKVVVRCFTKQVGLPELYPIKRMVKDIPEWWKAAPSTISNKELKDIIKKPISPAHPEKHNKTVKHCYAIQKLWERAISIPMWSEQIVAVTNESKTYGSSPIGVGGSQHPEWQYPGAIGNEWANWKMDSPWLIYTEEPLHFYMTDPFYHNQDHHWHTMPGITEFYNQHHSNINLILKKPSNKVTGIQYEFKPGDTLAYLIPMFDREYEIVVETISEEDYQKLEFAQKFAFNGATFTRKNNLGGCPFHRK